MKTILLTGATGNIGAQVIHFLYEQQTTHHLIAGVREVESARHQLAAYPVLDYRVFDFEQPKTFSSALAGVESVFLLRPPQLADVPKYFAPLIENAVKQNVREITFLSVQGVERSSIIPHHKIERLIQESGLDYCFLRPSYFMQNLTSTLFQDLKTQQKIILPAGHAKFSWIDAANIGEAAARILEHFEIYKNQAFEITGSEKLNFYEVAALMTEVLGQNITFESPNPFRYYFNKRRAGEARNMILVMIMLHFLPRFQKEPPFSDFYENLTGKKPTTLRAFLEREKKAFAGIMNKKIIGKG